MEKTTDNNLSSETPSQNELDLDFNRMEPITPKKVVKPEPSFFGKAKGLFSKKSAAENVNQFAVRKEPSLGTSQPQSVNPGAAAGNQANDSAAETLAAARASANATTASQTAAAEATANAESVSAESNTTSTGNAAGHIAAAAESVKAKVKKPEDWAVMQKLPPKHRRLVIAVVGAIVILAALLWLKPSKDTVEDFQSDNGNSLPIEFQPLDQTQTENAGTNNNVTASQENGAPQAADAQTTVPPAQPTPEQAGQTVPPAAPNMAPAQPAVAPNAEVPQPVAPTKPVAEYNKPVEKMAEKPAEKPRYAQPSKPVEPKAKSAATKPVEKKVPIVEAKPTNAAAKAKPAAAGSAKTLTVPQGTSLMQVFRDNHLNISDVNAMTKANGANGVLSSFKPGDKVQVVVNGQGRVSTMRLSNGSVFTRQADGTYKYSK
ncbi:opacity-associated protein OapA [Pasteurellaceae bacterium LIM206]|nr:opacity-associated protein OapA [Pasteurellaceae bacterium LIM206]